eukprot:Amastigsp_a508389_369.p1 type:complete len:269 gc:universal Amastigsp_a508389_369:1551-745(-)
MGLYSRLPRLGDNVLCAVAGAGDDDCARGRVAALRDDDRGDVVRGCTRNRRKQHLVETRDANVVERVERVARHGPCRVEQSRHGWPVPLLKGLAPELEALDGVARDGWYKYNGLERIEQLLKVYRALGRNEVHSPHGADRHAVRFLGEISLGVCDLVDRDCALHGLLVFFLIVSQLARCEHKPALLPRLPFASLLCHPPRHEPVVVGNVKLALVDNELCDRVRARASLWRGHLGEHFVLWQLRRRRRRAVTRRAAGGGRRHGSGVIRF